MTNKQQKQLIEKIENVYGKLSKHEKDLCCLAYSHGRYDGIDRAEEIMRGAK
jgi:hypothetical protein